MKALLQNRPLLVVLALIMVIVAAGVAVALGSDEGNVPPPATTPTTAAPPPPPATAPTQPTQTAPPPTQTTTAPSSDTKRRQAAHARNVQETVTDLIEAGEQGNSAVVCRITGQQASGSGLPAAQACARAVGLELSRLPTSDELSFQDITVKETSATARLIGGTTMTLRKRGNSWTVTRVKTATPSGGATAP